MATREEQLETLETLKGPRFYRVSISGYGGEAAYINLSKEAYEFWKDVTEENGDSDLVDYMVSAEDGDLDNLEIVVPPEAMFMQVEEDGEVIAYPWYEAPGEFLHQNGVEIGSAYLTVEEVDSGDYSAKYISDVIDGEDVSEIIERVNEETDYEVELGDYGEPDEYGEQGNYVCQFYSSEKGSFFEGTIETIGDFDVKKLKFIINEYPNGEDIIDGVMYDGVDIDNNGGDTNGKGYSAHVWANV